MVSPDVNRNWLKNWPLTPFFGLPENIFDADDQICLGFALLETGDKRVF